MDSRGDVSHFSKACVSCNCLGKTLRIAYLVTRADSVGGASVHVRDLAAGMRGLGHQVVVFVGGEGEVTDALRLKGVDFHPLQYLRRQLNPVLDWQALAELTVALREWKPDLLSVHTAKAGWIGRAASSRLGIPCVYTPHGWSIGDRLGAFRGELYTIAERIAAPWCEAIICVSEYGKQLALTKRVGKAEQLRVIRNGVINVPDGFRARPAAGNPVRLISVARFESPKDHSTLLQALARLGRDDWKLELIGSGPLQSAARDLAAALGLTRQIKFSGYLEDPSASLSDAHIFVLATRSEDLPRSIIEAMRAGLPVVASDVGGISELVTTEKTGILVPPRDGERLAEALTRLLRDGSLRQRLGDAGHLTFKGRFTFDRMLAETRLLYEEVTQSDV